MPNLHSHSRTVICFPPASMRQRKMPPTAFMSFQFSGQMTIDVLICEQKKTSLKQNIVNNNTLIMLELPLGRFLSGRCTPELLLVRAFQILNQNRITMVMAYVLERARRACAALQWRDALAVQILLCDEHARRCGILGIGEITLKYKCIQKNELSSLISSAVFLLSRP